jgi:tRNA pseudouridine32 synthase/23S rRNA pseudouridine746 synthase
MLSDRILHIDAHLIVLDKPAGLAVHPGPRTPRSLEDHLDELRAGFQRRPQPAHRLDRDTSGCLVLGRHPKAVKRLSALFADNRIGKLYWAVLRGAPEEQAGSIDAPLLKISSKADGWRVVVDPAGKPARSDWRVLSRAGDLSLVEFRPHTGRTHQIRVHAAHLGHPIVGDPVYGGGGGAMMLHSRAVTIPYRADGEPVTATAPVPSAMAALGFAVAE